MVHIPEWLPGGRLKAELKKWIHYGVSMVEAPYQTAKEAVVCMKNVSRVYSTKEFLRNRCKALLYLPLPPP